MFLERIHIENVRAIAGLELDLDSHNRRWTLLLGENGTGKLMHPLIFLCF